MENLRGENVIKETLHNILRILKNYFFSAVKIARVFLELWVRLLSHLLAEEIVGYINIDICTQDLPDFNIFRLSSPQCPTLCLRWNITTVMIHWTDESVTVVCLVLDLALSPVVPKVMLTQYWCRYEDHSLQSSQCCVIQETNSVPANTREGGRH